MRLTIVIPLSILIIYSAFFAIAPSTNCEFGRIKKATSNTPGLQHQFNQNKVVAHRGAWKNTGTPQNSIASLKAAIVLNCTGSETDVQMTADSILVINHDPDYAGLPIQKSTLKSLRETRLKNGEALPLMEDFLTIIKAQKGTQLFLEIKPSQKGSEWANATVKRVVQMVRDMEAQPWVVYISFDYEMCKEILRLQPSAKVQYLNGDKTPGQLKMDGIAGIDYHYSVFDKHSEWVKEAKERDILLNAWTVNKAGKMQKLINGGFNFITTNEPELLFKLLKKNAGFNKKD